MENRQTNIYNSFNSVANEFELKRNFTTHDKKYEAI